jgi:uncharacterized membrane protein YtjA (UPF0391 family)
MVKTFLLISVFALLGAILLFSACTITLPDGQRISLELREEEVQQEQPQQEEPQEQEQPQPQAERAAAAQGASTIFLIIMIASFAIAMVSAIFGFRKGAENSAGRVLFTIFIVLFLVMLTLYILSILNLL